MEKKLDGLLAALKEQDKQDDEQRKENGGSPNMMGIPSAPKTSK